MRTSIDIYLFWDNERANYKLNTLIWVWQYKNLHFHRLPFLLTWKTKINNELEDNIMKIN